LILSYFTGGTSTATGTASSAACGRAASGGFGNLTTGDQVLITTGTGVANNVSVSPATGAYSGYSVAMNTNNATSGATTSGFSTSVSGGTLINCTGANCATRTVDILGINRVFKDSSGNILFNHSLSTSTPFSVSGSGGSKTISSGVLILQHNLALLVATSTISQILTFSTAYCGPTSGKVITTFSTGKSSETVSFSSGSATVSGITVPIPACL
jgi:hypothetical protein